METYPRCIVSIISIEIVRVERCALLKEREDRGGHTEGRAIVKKCRRNIVHGGARTWNMVPSNKAVVLRRE